MIGMSFDKVAKLTVIAALCAVLGCSAEAPKDPLGVTCEQTAAAAPFNTTCTVRLEKALGASWCAFTFTNGSVSMDETRDCDGASLQVRVTNVGPAELTVSAMREKAPLAIRAVQFDAQNRAPVIESLSASPQTGPVPFSASIQWRVSDANADRVTCDLIVGGASVRTVPDCKSTTSHPVDLPLPGATEVTLIASDAYGGRTTSNILLTATRPRADFRIIRADIGQTLFSPSVPIVQNKQALLRVVATVDAPGLVASGGATLNLPDGGTAQLTLTSPKRVPTTVVDGDLSQVFWARIPADLVVPGMTVSVQLERPALLDDDNPDNESAVVSPPQMVVGTVPGITWVPILFEGVTGHVEDIDAALADLFPISAVRSTVRAPYQFTHSFADPYQGWGDLLSDMWSLRSADGATDTYYASISTSKGGDIGGMAFLGSPVASGLSQGALDVAPHEFGHTFNLDHAPCGPVGSSDFNYPYPGGVTGVEGVSVSGEVPALMAASRRDFMSYCSPTWISDYNYVAIRAWLSTRALRTPDEPGPAVLIRGSIRDGQLTLKPLLRFTAPVTAQPDKGVEVVINGAVQRLELLRSSEGSDVLHFAGLIKDPGQVKTLSVRHADAHWDRKPPQPNGAKRPQLIEQDGLLTMQWAPHRWAAVRHVHGDTRTTLALGLEGGSASLPVKDLPEGGAFEVSLSDGFNGEQFVHVRD